MEIQASLIPFETEPTQILEDAIDEFGAAARRVEVLDPQTELAARLPCPRTADRGAIGMPQVQPSRRRRSEPRHNH